MANDKWQTANRGLRAERKEKISRQAAQTQRGGRRNSREKAQKTQKLKQRTKNYTEEHSAAKPQPHLTWGEQSLKEEKERLEWVVWWFVKTKTTPSQDGLPREFLNRFGQHVTGFFSGFDRVRFRATLRPLFCPNGPEVYLNYCKVLIKNFKSFAQDLSDRLKKLAYEKFQQAGRPNIYLSSSELSKEALVQAMVAKEQLKEGPIVLLSCVEPCLTQTLSRPQCFGTEGSRLTASPQPRRVRPQRYP
jgi:hypothetical protein